MTPQEMIAVIQAHMDGHKIEYRDNSKTINRWQAAETPIWNFQYNDYRIKQEPKEIYILTNTHGHVTFHNSESEALRTASRLTQDCSLNRYVEDTDYRK